MGTRKNIVITTEETEKKPTKKAGKPIKKKTAVIKAAETKTVKSSTVGPASPATPAPAQAPARKKSKKVKKEQSRGEKYSQAEKLVDKNKLYPLKEALALAKKTAYTKFDGSIEAHFNLGIDPKEQPVRTLTGLPHGTGKTVKVLVFSPSPVKAADINGDQKTLSQLENGEIAPKRDFDVIVATPDWMPKLAKLAKFLGPKGLMPNPKAGTVTKDPDKVVASIKKGQVELRSETAAGLLHTIIGKVSFTEEQLLENFQAVLTALNAARPAKIKSTYIGAVAINATMGPGIHINLTSLV